MFGIMELAHVNSTEQVPTIVTYVSEPDGRGTISLLLSCLLTLILCVWPALHFNVPAQGTTTFQSVLLNARWITTGVFGPELVVFTAWRQWCAARLLTHIVGEKRATGFNKTTDNHSGSDADLDMGQSSCSVKWTMAHSFYAIAGGFAFEIDKNDPRTQFLPSACPSKLTLSARGVALLVECGYIPTVSEKDLWDKSKGNNMTKALVLIQALWMLAQICSRLVVHLPVTLLEVNTAAHM